jgi:hypothetical protein
MTAATYSDYIRMALDRPFVWGESDCVLFAFGALKARTGRDYLRIPVTWHTALEANRLLKELGGMRAFITSQLGEPCGVLRAGTGDVALVNDPIDDAELLGVCHGDVVLCPASLGLAMLPLRSAVCAWRVV